MAWGGLNIAATTRRAMMKKDILIGGGILMGLLLLEIMAYARAAARNRGRFAGQLRASLLRPAGRDPHAAASQEADCQDATRCLETADYRQSTQSPTAEAGSWWIRR